MAYDDLIILLTSPRRTGKSVLLRQVLAQNLSREDTPREGTPQEGSRTLSSYLDILELMGMAYIVRNTTNPLKALNSRRKVYTSSHFSPEHTDAGYLAESYVLERLLSCKKEVTYYRKRDKEVDFLVPNEKRALGVKYRSQINGSNFDYLRKFSAQHGYNPEVVTKKHFQLGEDGNLPYIPAMFF